MRKNNKTEKSQKVQDKHDKNRLINESQHAENLLRLDEHGLVGRYNKRPSKALRAHRRANNPQVQVRAANHAERLRRQQEAAKLAAAENKRKQAGIARAAKKVRDA